MLHVRHRSAGIGRARAGRVGVAAVAMIGGLLASASPAQAAAVVVDPSTGLTGLTEVTATATGLTAGQQVGFAQCLGTEYLTCASGPVDVADGTGMATATMVLSPVFAPDGGGGTVDCRPTACFVVAVDVSDLTNLGNAPITFTVDADPFPGNPTVTPSTGLADGQTVIVAAPIGSLAPSRDTYVRTCVAAAPGDCLVTGASDGSSTSSGAFSDASAIHRLTVVPGDVVTPVHDCAFEDCVLAVFQEPAGGGVPELAAALPIDFAAVPVSVRGTITDAGGPIAGMQVGLYRATGAGRIATATSGADGSYELVTLVDEDDVAGGNWFRVRAWDPGGAHVATWYDGVASASSATVVAPAPPTDTSDTTVEISGIDVHLAATATLLTGTVSARGGGAVAGATVALYPAVGTGVVAVTTTDPGGSYAFTGILPGSYRMKVTHPSFFSEWYQDSFSAGTADTIVLSSGTIVIPSGVNGVTLAPVAAPDLGGTVTSAGSPVAGATVRLYTSSGQIASTVTDGSGFYGFGSAITVGTTYRIKVEAAGHPVRWYATGTTYATATGVFFVAPGSGVNVDLP